MDGSILHWYVLKYELNIKTMETILWKSPSDWGGADDLVRKIKELINENYSILNVVPLEYMDRM